MKKLSVFAVLAAIIAVGCKKEEAEKPKVIYENTAKTRTAAPADTTQIEIADLPIFIDGTSVMVHPIGTYRVDGRRRAGYGYERGSFTISNFSDYELTGFLQNIKFENFETGSIVALTDKEVSIQTATFLVPIDKTRPQVVVYTLTDMDTNKDGRFDANDIRSLYISDIDGRNFTKISPDYQELIDWSHVENRDRLYFRTIEDTNKNGEFDKDDLLHYHFVNTSGTDWVVENYTPVD